VSFTLITETYKDMLKILKALLLQKKQIQQPAQILASTPALVKTPEEWKVHWQAQGQEWRTEPEISTQRQDELVQRRTIKPNIEKGAYPFKGVKLNRADVEWLLALHENRRGPVDWRDKGQRERLGIDIRGANLSFADLRNLPLAALQGGLAGDAWVTATEEQRTQAAVYLADANLSGAHLEGAILSNVSFTNAQMSYASLFQAHIEGANLSYAQLKEACFILSILTGATLIKAQMEGADFSRAHMELVNLSEANMNQATLYAVHLQSAYLPDTQMKETVLFQAQLEQAKLIRAHLEGANLVGANLKGADLSKAHLEDVNLGGALLQEANLSGTQMDGVILENVTLIDEKLSGPKLVDVYWGKTNLAVVKWSLVTILGDEKEAQQTRRREKGKDTEEQIKKYEHAVRANRQLAVALQSQGLNEQAAHFTYRAQVLQRAVFRFEMTKPTVKLKYRLQIAGNWLFSWFMCLVAGYGYRFGRSFLTYLTVISGFATLYYLYGATDIDAHNKPGPHHLSWYEAFVVSMTAFHGRGFFVGTFSPGDPQALVAAIEAFLGLLIEVIFIATLTRRLFTQ